MKRTMPVPGIRISLSLQKGGDIFPVVHFDLPGVFRNLIVLTHPEDLKLLRSESDRVLLENDFN